MNKSQRLEYMRSRLASRIPLSERAAEVMEELQAEDSDLGVATFGECLAPDDVRKENGPLETEDESEYNTRLISPSMREVES